MTQRGAGRRCVKVRLFRPFSVEHFSRVLPAACASLAMLDRTKEPAIFGGTPRARGRWSPRRRGGDGRASLRCRASRAGAMGSRRRSSRPAMIKAVLDEHGEQPAPRRRFSVGIHDDVSGTSSLVRRDVRHRARGRCLARSSLASAATAPFPPTRRPSPSSARKPRSSCPGALRIRLEKSRLDHHVASAL
jgi:hypothetical protein